MSMMRKIFRPGQGAVHKRFAAAFVNATTSYRGDIAVWDTTPPTDQGASGVLEGKTLGANDFIYVTIAPATAANSIGILAGVYEGKAVGDRDTVNFFPDNSLAIVQTWGIHDSVYMVDDTVAAGALIYMSTTAGAGQDVAASTVIGTDSVNGGALGMVGVAMTADALYTRGTTSVSNVCGFIRCDY